MALILLMQSRRVSGVTAADVSKRLRISSRQAHRYLLAVEAAGLPVVVEEEENASVIGTRFRWRLMEGA